MRGRGRGKMEDKYMRYYAILCDIMPCRWLGVSRVRLIGK
jgi:hypothetical protein